MKRILFAAFAASLFVACSHTEIRMPAAAEAPTYNPQRVKLLKTAAENGILFQIPDSAIRDVPVRQLGERCRRAGESQWAENLYGILDIIDRNPAYSNKIHVIEFKRGDQPKVEISKDLDGATYLTVMYSKIETREKANTLEDIPCAESDMSLLGKDVTVTSFVWPTRERISSFLGDLQDRPSTDRFNFDRQFITWLASQMTIFRLSPEIAFEKTPAGQPLLAYAMSQFSNQMANGKRYPELEFWMREISLRSTQGKMAKFFGLRRDTSLAHGLQVDTLGEFVRSLNGFSDPSYPYVSYKLENGEYQMAGLDQLNQCLGGLTSIYRSPVASMTNYNREPASFMSPGHQCRQDP